MISVRSSRCESSIASIIAILATELSEAVEDAVTHEAYELITHTASIKAILAGHMHYDYVSQVTPTLKQYVVNTESCNIVTVR